MELKIKEAILELKHLLVLATHGVKTDKPSLLNKNLDKRVETLNFTLSILETVLAAQESLPPKEYDPTSVNQPDYPDDFTKGKVYFRRNGEYHN